MFARNVGTIDRLLRIVVGVMLIVLAAYGTFHRVNRPIAAQMMLSPADGKAPL